MSHSGARQVGKSTLVQSLQEDFPAQYLTLDDATVLAAASRDATGFLAGLDGPVILDEVQRAPDCSWRSRRQWTETAARGDIC